MLQSTYLPQTQQLLQNPAAPNSLYGTPLLIGYINTARGQLAGETACIRSFATLTTVAGQQSYPFSSFTLGTPALTGIAGAINVNQVFASVGGGQVWLPPQEWEWFSLYFLNNIIPVQALPTVWAQFGQGAAPPGGLTGASFGGSLYFYPIPDQAYTLTLDCSCYPISLAQDTDIEAIPYLWTDAVPFFAAYYALLSSQVSMRVKDADGMLQRYQIFVQRARQAANPQQTGTIYQGAPDPIQQLKIMAGQQR